MTRVGIAVQGMLASRGSADPLLLHDMAGQSVIARTCAAAMRLARRLENHSGVEAAPILLLSSANKPLIDGDALPDGLLVHDLDDSSPLENLGEVCRRFDLAHVARVIGNNVLTSPRHGARLVAEHLASGADYTYGVGYPQGILPSEVVSARAIVHPLALERESSHSVNISASIKTEDGVFPRAVLRASREIFNYSAVNFSVTSEETARALETLAGSEEVDFTAPPPFFNAPVSFTYYISNESCNLNCVMCRLGSLREKGHWLTAEQSRAILGQFPSLGKVTVGSGEPLLSPHFVPIVTDLASRGAQVYLITNGTLISKKNVEAVARSVTEIQLSMDGATKDTYEAVREGGNFNRLLDSIRLLQDTRRRLPDARIKRITGWYVYMERNYREMAEFVSLMHELGIENAAFSSCFPKSGPPFDVEKITILDYEDLARQRDRARERGRELGVNVSYMFSEGEWRWEDCGAYQKTVTIGHDGEVYPCCMLKDSHSMGNLLNTHLIELWNSEEWREFRYALFSSAPTAPCRRACGFRAGTANTDARLKAAVAGNS